MSENRYLYVFTFQVLEVVVGPPAEVPAAIDSGMWLNMVNVKPPHLIDLEVESMKKFILLDYKR